MKTNLLKFAALFVIAIIAFTTACDDTEQPDNVSVEDDARGSFIVADAFAVSNDQTDGGKVLFECGENGSFEPEATDNGWKMTFTNCEHNGVTRNGTVIVRVNNWSLLGGSLSITFENYTMDGDSISGTITAAKSAGLTQINVKAEDMRVVFANGESMSWSSDMVYTIDLGVIGDITDNTYKISGNASGINREGQSYTSVYNEVTVSGTCQWPVSGTVTLTQEEGNPTIVNFGNGECDNSVEVSKGTFTTTIDL